MKKLLFILLALICFGVFDAAAQMTDSQVVSYAKSALAQGKDEKTIGRELLARGVTMEQVERLRAQYENTQGSETISADNQMSSSVLRNSARTESAADLEAVAVSANSPIEEARTASISEIYGHNVFTNKNLTFEPNENLPTPENYVLGPGDEVVIEIWGANEAAMRETISPEGRINVSQIGPIYLNGMTIKKANDVIRRAFASKYAGVMGDQPISDVSVTLGQIRTIQVNIFGEVAVPGTYRLSSFSTVFHALYRAGGVTDLGTVRSINVVRSGKVIASVDIYPFVKEGITNSNVRLQDGDVINVPLYENVVDVMGKVKKPMHYELKAGETLENLFDYAGGFEGDAYSQEVRITRVSGREREVLTVSESQYDSFVLKAGDAVTVSGMLDRYANRVEVRGSVFRPGFYELGREIYTVKDLINRAEGLLEDAFTERVRLLRQKEDFTPEVLSFNLKDLMAGRTPDITLRKNDVLVISSIHELKELGTLSINGLVALPGDYTFAENTSVEDLILQAGGLLDGASSARVEIARRIMNPGSEMPSDSLATVYTFPLDLSLAKTSAAGFILEPYDVVSVRKSPEYRAQSNVEIRGEVAFPGMYTMTSNNNRLSDLVKRAGGLSPHSYIRGAILSRRMSTDEYNTRDAVRRMIGQGGGRDSIDVTKLSTRDTYTVALELDRALEQPGSEYDLVLREGDLLIVPEYVSTVKIDGDVMYPNTVTFKSGANLHYYINKAGGYGSSAKRNKAYVVYMNGDVSRARVTAKIEPGCQIIVPSKQEKKNGSNTSQSLAVASTATSLATAVATLARLFF